MENLAFIIGLLILAALACSLIWSTWPAVIAVLALIGLAQLDSLPSSYKWLNSNSF